LTVNQLTDTNNAKQTRKLQRREVTTGKIEATSKEHCHTRERSEWYVPQKMRGGGGGSYIKSKLYKYVCITTNQPVTKSNANPIPNPTTKQYAVVSIQLNIVTCPTCPDKFIRGKVIARSVFLTFTLPHDKAHVNK